MEPNGTANGLTQCPRSETFWSVLRPAIFHEKVRASLRTFPEEVRRAFGKAILEVQNGIKLVYPLSKPMIAVGHGVEEIRIKDRSGAYRVFYLAKSKRGILVFHAFIKRTEKTPQKEIEMGKRRLREMTNA